MKFPGKDFSVFGCLQKSGSKFTLEDLKTIHIGAMSQKTHDLVAPSQYHELGRPPDIVFHLFIS